MKIQWKSMPSPGKGKARKNPARAGRVARKEKKATQAKVTGETTTGHWRFEGECRNCGKYGHKAADCWYKQPPKPQRKGKGSGKSKSKVTEISESDRSKQVEETWTRNTIGCADEGLWVFSLEDSKKRRHTVKINVATRLRSTS